jgi:hypothetical protein
MDTLVARYSRPAYHQNEVFTEQEQQDLADAVPGMPSLSLKFAMPPVAHVSSLAVTVILTNLLTRNVPIAVGMASSRHR